MSGGAAQAGEFDYVVVGSGAAGAIVAARLSEDASASVCVLEAGPADGHPYLKLPAGFIKVIFNPELAWQFGSEPTARTGPAHSAAPGQDPGLHIDQRPGLQPGAARGFRRLGGARQSRLVV